MAGQSNNSTKFSTQLGRVVAMLIIAGLVWLVNEYVLSPSDDASDDNTYYPPPATTQSSAAIVTDDIRIPEPANASSESNVNLSGASNSQNNTTTSNDTMMTTDSTGVLPPTDFVGGWPAASADLGEVQVLTNLGYATGYSSSRRTPLWVAYELIDKWQTDQLGRPDRFEADARVRDPVEYYDYSNSGYTRGHLAPSFSIGKSHGAAAQVETFLMTNITPQLESFNRKWWQRLEEVAISRFTKRLNNVWVITGPVFDANRTYLDSGVDIPDAFYKILLAKKRDGSFVSLAFLVPQSAGGTERLSQYLVSIDTIERQTGIDFLVKLPDSIEDRLEQQRSADQLWKLSEVDDLPPRY